MTKPQYVGTSCDTKKKKENQTQISNKNKRRKCKTNSDDAWPLYVYIADYLAYLCVLFVQ